MIQYLGNFILYSRNNVPVSVITLMYCYRKTGELRSKCPLLPKGFLTFGNVSFFKFAPLQNDFCSKQLFTRQYPTLKSNSRHSPLGTMLNSFMWKLYFAEAPFLSCCDLKLQKVVLIILGKSPRSKIIPQKYWK